MTTTPLFAIAIGYANDWGQISGAGRANGGMVYTSLALAEALAERLADAYTATVVVGANDEGLIALATAYGNVGPVVELVGPSAEYDDIPF